MDENKILEACQQALTAAENGATEDQLRNAALNLRYASGYRGIDPNSLRPFTVEGDKTVYTDEISRDDSIRVIASIQEWAKGMIERPVRKTI